MKSNHKLQYYHLPQRNFRIFPLYTHIIHTHNLFRFKQSNRQNIMIVKYTRKINYNTSLENANDLLFFFNVYTVFNMKIKMRFIYLITSVVL